LATLLSLFGIDTEPVVDTDDSVFCAEMEVEVETVSISRLFVTDV